MAPPRGGGRAGGARREESADAAGTICPMAVATAPTGVSNAELIRWAFEAINRHDAPSLAQLYTAETVERFPDRTCRGGAEIVAYFEDVFAAVRLEHADRGPRRAARRCLRAVAHDG